MRKAGATQAQHHGRNRAWRLLFLAAVMVAGMALAIRLGFAPQAPARETADFTGLVDTSGRTLEAAGVADRYKLVAYGYTSCPDACPATLTKMHNVLAALQPDLHGLVPIFITLDPAHDTVDVLGAYVGHFDARIVGLTGELTMLNASAARLHALPMDSGEQRTPDGGPNHAVRLYLLAPDNTLLRTYELNDATHLIATDVGRRVIVKGKGA